MKWHPHPLYGSPLMIQQSCHWPGGALHEDGWNHLQYPHLVHGTVNGHCTVEWWDWTIQSSPWGQGWQGRITVYVEVYVRQCETLVCWAIMCFTVLLRQWNRSKRSPTISNEFKLMRNILANWFEINHIPSIHPHPKWLVGRAVKPIGWEPANHYNETQELAHGVWLEPLATQYKNHHHSTVQHIEQVCVHEHVRGPIPEHLCWRASSWESASLVLTDERPHHTRSISQTSNTTCRISTGVSEFKSIPVKNSVI